MSESSTKLQEMLDVADQEISNIDNSLSQLQSQIDELQSQIDAITDGMLDVINIDMTTLLEAKMIEFDGSSIEYPGDFGISTVSDFKILDSTGNIVYEYEGINWDDDPDIQDDIDKFNFGIICFKTCHQVQVCIDIIFSCTGYLSAP